ncbi:hypothetical protein N2152v2_002464 [Parachlorella kessleri]
MQLIAQGSQDAGRELLQKGISTAVQQLGTSNHPMVAVMSNQASVIYMIGSMYEDAEAAARESLTIIKNFCVPTSVEVAACQLRLAAILVARQQVAEAKRLLATVTTSLSGSEQHQDAFGEALFYTGMCQLLGAHSYEAVRRLDDLLVEVGEAGLEAYKSAKGLRKFGEKIDLQRPLVDVALREHALLRSRAEERGEWGVVEALLQQALLLVKQVGVAVQLRGLLALQLGVVQFKHRGKEELARETFAAALEALGDTVDDSMDIVQQGLRRYEVLSDLLKRYGAGALNQG